MVGLLDIQFTRIGDNELEATMPVDCRTHQPFGLLHGGASRRAGRNALGSVAGYLCTEGEQKVVGLEVNANHIRSVPSGRVRGAAGRCMLEAAIRCGRLISWTRGRIACVVHPG